MCYRGRSHLHRQRRSPPTRSGDIRRYRNRLATRIYPVVELKTARLEDASIRNEIRKSAYSPGLVELAETPNVEASGVRSRRLLRDNCQPASVSRSGDALKTI